MQLHQSIIHNFVIHASFQTEMRPVALSPEGNNCFPGFYIYFLPVGRKIPATSSLAACCRFVTDWAWSTQQTTARCTIRTDRDTRNQEFCQKTPRWHDSITSSCSFFIFDDKFFIRRRSCNNRWGKDLMAAALGRNDCEFGINGCSWLLYEA